MNIQQLSHKVLDRPVLDSRPSLIGARNSGTATISHVPDDILHEIFLFVAELSYKRGPGLSVSSDSQCPYDIPILTVSHVSRHWRRLAIASPQLWAYIIIDTRSKTEMLKAYLDRSQGCPLYIRFEGPFGTFIEKLPETGTAHVDRMADILTPHVERFVELHAIKLEHSEAKSVLTPLANLAPQMRSLMLSAYKYHDLALHWCWLLADGMPSLREIYVKGVSIPWMPYAGLHSLILWDQVMPPLTDLLSALRRCPSLKILHLSLLGDPTRVYQRALKIDDLVELPRLQELTLHSSVHQVVLDILSHLDFPATTVVDLKFKRGQLLAAVQEHPFVRKMTSLITELHLELVSAQQWTRYISITSQNPRIQMQWEWSENEGTQEQLLDSIGWTASSFPAARQLTIQSISSPLDEEHWGHIFAAVPNVETMVLDIHRSMVFRFFNALKKNSATSYGLASSPHALVLPALQNILVARIEEHELVYKSMAECFQVRANQGSHLQSLELLMHTGRLFPPAVLDLLNANTDKVTIRY